MKTFLISMLCCACLIAGTTSKSIAQIPNNGFEDWTDFGNYQDPTYWGSTNSFSAGSFYAITQSTDHYPEAVGSYSVRLENNAALNPSNGARGSLFTGPPPPDADFTVTGNPTSLTGYYKFAPQNGDTMFIQIQLYFNGSSVAFGEFTSTTAAPDWTPFTIPISSYANADGGSMIIAAYNANGFNFMPHGNSVLYVDNLNFDNLITDVTAPLAAQVFSIYPNPASETLTITTPIELAYPAVATVFNGLGQVLLTKQLNANQQQLDVSNLPSGVYTISLETSLVKVAQKILVY